jgi:hypothetical protein
MQTIKKEAEGTNSQQLYENAILKRVKEKYGNAKKSPR